VPDRRRAMFEGLMDRISGRFTRVEPRLRAGQLMLGLLADLPREHSTGSATTPPPVGSDVSSHPTAEAADPAHLPGQSTEAQKCLGATSALADLLVAVGAGCRCRIAERGERGQEECPFRLP
jgi:hypothetical protein